MGGNTTTTMGDCGMSARVYMYVFMYRGHICTHIHAHTYRRERLWQGQTNVTMATLYVYICMCVYCNIHYIHMYTHTHTHTYAQTGKTVAGAIMRQTNDGHAIRIDTYNDI